MKIPNVKLTVIIRNDSPTHWLQDPPTYRTVTIDLTQEQLEKLALRVAYEQSGHVREPRIWYEEISTSFLEDADQ